jgi:hypothetical protein
MRVITATLPDLRSNGSSSQDGVGTAVAGTLTVHPTTKAAANKRLTDPVTHRSINGPRRRSQDLSRELAGCITAI